MEGAGLPSGGEPHELKEFEELSDEHFEALKKAVSNWDRLNADEVARRNFGEHAQVTATLEGFSVDFYEHD